MSIWYFFFNYTTVDGRKQNEHLYMFKLFECMMMPMRIYGFMMFHVSYIPGAHQISPRQGKPIDYLTRLFMSKRTTKLFESVKQLLTLQWLFMAKTPTALKAMQTTIHLKPYNHKGYYSKGPCKPSNLRQTGWKFISWIHVQDGIVSQPSSVYFVKDGHFIDKMAMAQNHELPGQSTIVPKPELRRCWGGFPY